ncbi:hypothetical protein IA929_03995 [Listeria seeligeri]|uniref:hypothetical protein n=1 Tax=Listeria seeligeri TaxID=1640 RepID=UPI001887163E|nr:hypothetical protein [Listeria seeligeri]MBF2599163.1 hypothetical protein [Listeria seeligeri]
MNSLETLLILKNTSTISHNKKEYFSLLAVKDVINSNSVTKFNIEDGKIYEIYQNELLIRTEKFIGIENYILERTGKKDLADISKQIIDLNKHCYYEVSTADGYFEAIKSYIDYIVVNKDTISNIEKNFTNYNVCNIYVEIF